MKFDIYRRIAAVENKEEQEDMLEELIDRFGDPPTAVMNLLDITLLRGLAHSLYITEVKTRPDMITLTMYEKAKIRVEKIPELLEVMGGNMTFRHAEPAQFLCKLQGGRRRFSGNLLEITREVLETMCMLKEEEEK